MPAEPKVLSARPEMTERIKARTGLDEDILVALVPGFYAKVRQAPVLGPIFAERITDWAPHIDRMVAFWSSVALVTGRYHGAPKPALRTAPFPCCAKKGCTDDRLRTC